MSIFVHRGRVGAHSQNNDNNELVGSAVETLRRVFLLFLRNASLTKPWESRMTALEMIGVLIKMTKALPLSLFATLPPLCGHKHLKAPGLKKAAFPSFLMHSLLIWKSTKPNFQKEMEMK